VKKGTKTVKSTNGLEGGSAIGRVLAGPTNRRRRRRRIGRILTFWHWNLAFKF
jgi:hypothetical protein